MAVAKQSLSLVHLKMAPDILFLSNFPLFLTKYHSLIKIDMHTLDFVSHNRAELNLSNNNSDSGAKFKMVGSEAKQMPFTGKKKKKSENEVA